MRLCIDGLLRPNAEVIVRAVRYRALRGDFDTAQKSSCPASRASGGILVALFLGDLNLDIICAPGKFRFLRIVSGGEPVRRKVLRPVVSIVAIGEMTFVFRFLLYRPYSPTNGWSRMFPYAKKILASLET